MVTPELTPAQAKSRRMRATAVGAALGGLVVLIYALTLAKLGLHGWQHPF